MAERLHAVIKTTGPAAANTSTAAGSRILLGRRQNQVDAVERAGSPKGVAAMRRYMVWLFLVVAAAGCGAGGGEPPQLPRSVAASPSGPTPAGSTPSTAPPTASATVSARPQPSSPGASDVLVLFGRTGGLVGVSDDLTVRQDGAFTLRRSRPAVTRSGHLTRAELADLRRDLDRADFAHLPKVQPARGNDLHTYLVTYGGYRILAQDGGIEPPLRPVIGALSGIVDRYGA